MRPVLSNEDNLLTGPTSLRSRSNALSISPHVARAAGIIGFGDTSPSASIGCASAMGSLLTCLSRSSDLDTVLCTHPMLRSAVERSHPLNRVIPITLMLSDLDAHGPASWTELSEQWHGFLSLRAAEPFLRTAPALCVLHTVSYPQMLLNWALSSLMLGASAHDGIVCSSRALQRAVKKMLAYVTDSFGRSFSGMHSCTPELALIPLPVDTEAYHPRRSPELRQRLGLSDTDVIILCAGRYAVGNKADLGPLLLAFAKLVTHCKDNVRLLLAGADPHNTSRFYLRLSEELGIRPQCSFLVDLTAEEMRELYSCADIFVSLADNVQESFGLTVAEAMSSGLPCVVSDWSGYRDLVIEGETGFLVPTAWMDCYDDLEHTAWLCGWEYDHMAIGQSIAVDTESLQQALLTLLRQPDLRHTMGEQARKRASALLSMPIVGKMYDELRKELCMRSAGASNTARGIQIGSRYSHLFAHFATHELSADSRLRANPAALPLNTPALIRQPYPELTSVVLRNDLLQHCWRAVAECPVRTVGQVEQLCLASLDCTRSTVRRHLMWLLKYGYIQTIY